MCVFVAYLPGALVDKLTGIEHEVYRVRGDFPIPMPTPLGPLNVRTNVAGSVKRPLG